MPEEGGDDCVKVAIRCRPPSKKEIGNNESCIVEMTESFRSDHDVGQVILNDPSEAEEPAKFAFDIVFGLDIQQETVYSCVGLPALLKTFEGFNGTIFAYGQTGSGKSWSMVGGAGDLRGITPRVNEALFERIAELQEGTTRKFLVMCSFFEIYNEIIFDLLNPVADRSKLGGGLQIKEHPALGIYVKDLTEIVADDAAKLEQMLDSGAKSRAVSSTMMNSVSSRSHSIFTIKIHQKDTSDPSRNVFAKLNLVDLAGSERQKGTGATGQTLKEGANINKSLSALGNVINALVETANGKKVFIPYRNSKLTRVLQESLGGNSLCTMLATLSPAACNYEETMSTLRYANRAKAIKVSATKNEEASQISRLKAEVEELKKKLVAGGGGGGGGGLTDAERRAEQERQERQLHELENVLNSNWSEKDKLSKEHEERMNKISEEQARAERAVDEERARRLKLLQEKNDPELSIRGYEDLVVNLPKSDRHPPVLSGDVPRHWLKLHRAMRQHVDELKEQNTSVLVLKHAFDEDVRLWGEGADARDISLASTGLNRCVLKLAKLRKGGEKLLQSEAQGLSSASELGDGVRDAIAQLQGFHNQVTVAAEKEDNRTQQPTAAQLEEVGRMLCLIDKQVQETIAEVAQLASFDMGQTCELVLQLTRDASGTGEPEQDCQKHCERLQRLLDDPNAAALPASMPQKPLREFEAGDVTDNPEDTAVLVGSIIRWEVVCGGKHKKGAHELLARPPPKFVLDVTMAVKALTGYPENLDGDWPENRDERLAKLRFISDAVAESLGAVIDFEPADVLKGKEVHKTLKLLQLLAVAAARQMPVEGSGMQHRPPGLTAPRALLAVLDAMGQCIQNAKQYTQRDSTATSQAAVDDQQNLEDRIAVLEPQVEEEVRQRLQAEESLAELENKLLEFQAQIKTVSLEREQAEQSAKEDPEHLELQRQREELLNDASNPENMDDVAVIRILRAQSDEVRRCYQRHDHEMQELEANKQKMDRCLAEAQASKRQFTAEMQTLVLRRETEETLLGKSPQEQEEILGQHAARSTTRAAALEEQILARLTAIDELKMSGKRHGEEAREVAALTEDTQLQCQIATEERDAIREVMEKTFNEKAAAEEELLHVQQIYTDLTERFSLLQDERDDVENLLEQKRNQVKVTGAQAEGA